MLTVAIVSLVVVLGKVLFSGVVLTLAGQSVTFGTIDAMSIAAILTPTLSAYVARKYSDSPDRKSSE